MSKSSSFLKSLNLPRLGKFSRSDFTIVTKTTGENGTLHAHILVVDYWSGETDKYRSVMRGPAAQTCAGALELLLEQTQQSLQEHCDGPFPEDALDA